VAIRCANCGHELPREDARFCSYCGNENPSQPQSQSLSQPAPSHPAAPQAPGAGKAAPDTNATPWFGFDGPQGQNATPWFGFDGPRGKNATPWFGCDGPVTRSAQDVENVHASVANVSGASDLDVEDMPTRQVPKERVEQPDVEDLPTRQVPKERASVTPVAPGATKAVKPRFARPHTSKRTPFVAMLALVAVVIVIGVAAIAMTNPFGNSVDTSPRQTVQNSALGVTLSDPAGWKQSTSGNTWTLSDSTKTAQMTITQSAPTSTDLAGYLNKQATQMEMSNAKAGSTVTFAGTSWMQERGDYLNQGATYSGTIYAAIHNGHLYTLTQVAPKVTFNDEERLVFSPARTSFKFK
jgi:hypothetical protein